jgi:hypothetical protein
MCDAVPSGGVVGLQSPNLAGLRRRRGYFAQGVPEQGTGDRGVWLPALQGRFGGDSGNPAGNKSSPMKKTHLTPTGLLMQGDFTQIPALAFNGSGRSLDKVKWFCGRSNISSLCPSLGPLLDTAAFAVPPLSDGLFSTREYRAGWSGRRPRTAQADLAKLLPGA